MTTIASREPEESSQKLPRINTKYAPLHISDELVEDMARHLYTQDAIAKRFKISVPTLMTDWGEAYHRGAMNTLDTPKAEILRMAQDAVKWRETKDDYFDPPRERSWMDKDAPFDKAYTLFKEMANRYEPKPKDEPVELKGGIMIVPMTKGDDTV